MNWRENYTIIGINLTDFLFKTSDDIDIKPVSLTAWKVILLMEITLIAITSLFVLAIGNLEWKMNKINLEWLSFVLMLHSPI